MTRVLVVEDEPDIREVVAEALTGEGYDVECVEDGAAALSTIRNRPPDLAIVDLMMPLIDGQRFLKECRADPRCAHMRIVVVTAATDSRLQGLDAQALIPKPFDLNDLIDIVLRLAPV